MRGRTWQLVMMQVLSWLWSEGKRNARCRSGGWILDLLMRGSDLRENDFVGQHMLHTEIEVTAVYRYRCADILLFNFFMLTFTRTNSCSEFGNNNRKSMVRLRFICGFSVVILRFFCSFWFMAGDPQYHDGDGASLASTLPRHRNEVLTFCTINPQLALDSQ